MHAYGAICVASVELNAADFEEINRQTKDALYVINIPDIDL